MSKRRRVATWWFRRPDEIVAIPSTARGDEIAVFHGERRSAIQAAAGMGPGARADAAAVADAGGRAMSEKDMDEMPRMKDTLRPEDLNTDACANLAGKILKGLANDYIMARRKYNHQPTPEKRQALERIRKLYRSEWFGT